MINDRKKTGKSISAYQSFSVFYLQNKIKGEGKVNPWLLPVIF